MVLANFKNLSSKMIIAEILSYKADIICLQEVDASIHNSLISPVLKSKGYHGFYSNKVTSQQEGCSLFWSTSVFEVAKSEDMQEFPLRSLLTKDASLDESEYYNAKSTVRELVKLERWESINGIRQLLEDHDEVRRVYSESVGQILQVVRLSPKQAISSKQGCSSKPDSIVVANTHLFYHPSKCVVLNPLSMLKYTSYHFSHNLVFSGGAHPIVASIRCLPQAGSDTSNGP